MSIQNPRRTFDMNTNLRKYDVIPVLVKVAKNAVKEKVTRVIVATFRVRSILYEYEYHSVD
jgi:hypothetical protein